MGRCRTVEPRERLLAVALAAMIVGSTVAGVVSVGVGVARAANTTTVEGTPELSASAPDARLDPGENGAVSIYLENNAKNFRNDGPYTEEMRDRVTEARSIAVNITDTKDAPLSVETGQQPAGTIQDGNSSGPHTFNVVVDEDAEAGTYELEVTTEYRHTSQATYEKDETGTYRLTDETTVERTDTDTITVEIQPQPRFEISDVSHDVPLGGEGMVSLEITNAGDEDVTESGVSVTSGDSDFYFGSGTASSEANVGPWNAGETKTLRFRAGTVDAAVQREYPIDVSVDYTDSDDAQQTATESIGITPRNRTRFDVVDVTHDVPRNGEGTITVTVEHTAGKTIEDVTATASTTASDVYLGSEGSRSSRSAVESWQDNETRNLTFRVGTSDDALNRSYPLDLEFEYTDAADNDNSRTAFLEFSPADRERFEVSIADHDVPQNGEGTLSVNVMQLTNKTLEDVTVTASTTASDVYLGSESSRSSTTAIGRWDGNETQSMTFRVGTTENALNRTYPIDLEFEYTDATDNDNAWSDTVEFVPGPREDFAVEGLTHDVPQDGVGTVTVAAENTAGKNLSEVSVTTSTPDSEIYVGSESSRSGTATVTDWAAGETRQLTFHVGATANAVNRSYPLNVDFEYTDAADNDNQWATEVAFRPDGEPQFVVESIDHDVPIGSSGRVTLTIRNDGPVNATQSVATASADADAMFFGTGGAEPIEVQGVSVEPPQTGTPTAQTFVGEWPVGEARTVSFRAGFDDNAIVRDYVANLAISYENGAGDEMPDQTQSVGVEPLPEQRFSFDRVESDLYVGEEGNLHVSVRNTGQRRVDGLVVTASSQDQNVNFYNSRYAVGELAPNETATVRYRVGVTEEAEHSPRIFELTARYRDPQQDVRQTDSRDVTAEIGASRDAFTLERTNGTFAPGESGPLSVTVTNRRNETLSNVQASLFTDDPLDSEDDSAFIPELRAGESTTITLDLSVGGGASEKTYAASMEFRFDDERGESDLSDTYRIPVVVEQTESGVGLPVVLGGVGVLVALVVLGWYVGALSWLRAVGGDLLQRMRSSESSDRSNADDSE